MRGVCTSTGRDGKSGGDGGERQGMPGQAAVHGEGMQAGLEGAHSQHPQGSSQGRNDHVGLRCAADASAYLFENASEWGIDADARERLGAVGERFGRQALPLLIELAARPGASEGLGVLLEGARR